MAFDAYMWVDKGTGGAPEGETTDKVYKAKKAWEILSFSFGASNPAHITSDSTGSATGRVSISSFSIMKRTDKASAQMFQSCCDGSFFAKAYVRLRKSGGKAQNVFLGYNFARVYVDSIQWSGSSGGDDVPTESVSFSFEQCVIAYGAQDKDGNITLDQTASWNLATNVKEAPDAGTVD